MKSAGYLVISNNKGGTFARTAQIFELAKAD